MLRLGHHESYTRLWYTNGVSFVPQTVNAMCLFGPSAPNRDIQMRQRMEFRFQMHSTAPKRAEGHERHQTCQCHAPKAHWVTGAAHRPFGLRTARRSPRRGDPRVSHRPGRSRTRVEKVIFLLDDLGDTWQQLPLCDRTDPRCDESEEEGWLLASLLEI